MTAALNVALQLFKLGLMSLLPAANGNVIAFGLQLLCRSKCMKCVGADTWTASTGAW